MTTGQKPYGPPMFFLTNSECTNGYLIPTVALPLYYKHMVLNDYC